MGEGMSSFWTTWRVLNHLVMAAKRQINFSCTRVDFALGAVICQAKS